MNKEHLESDLTIKASYKVGHILKLTHLQIAPIFRPPENRIHTFAMGEIGEESRSTHNFNILMALL